MNSYRADNHIHTHLSFDGRPGATMAAYARRALELGLDEVCFTDHLDWGCCLYNENPLDLDVYQREYARLTEEVTGVTLSFGIEAGLTAEYAREVNDALERDYDFIIASQHIVDGLDVYFDKEFYDPGRKEAYCRYLRVQYELLTAFDRWSVVGHIGYFARYAPYDHPRLKYTDAPDIIDAILGYAISTGRGIEINTGGRERLGDFLPPRDVVGRYLELGGEIITIGSDCHEPKRLYDGIEDVKAFLRSRGAKYFATYRELKPVFHTL